MKAKCTNIADVDNLALSEKDLECVVIDSIDTVSSEIAFSTEYDFGCAGINSIRPYLRPMSSMTEEEQEEYDKWHQELEEGRIKDWKYAEYNDWLNAHHIDYRGLIPMGLALEAPEDMYKTE